jgi:hypothetical protein
VIQTETKEYSLSRVTLSGAAGIGGDDERSAAPNPRPEEIEMSRPAPQRPLFKLTAAVAVLVLWTTVLTSGVRAQEQSTLKIKRTIKLDAVGNADIRLTLTAPTNVYTTLKIKTPNVAVLLRKLGAGRHWAFLENIDGSFNDLQSCVDIHYTQRGLARIERAKQWSIAFDSGTVPDLVDIHGTTAIYEETTTNQVGLASMIIRVDCPAGSVNLKNNPGTRSFSYEFEPKVSEKGTVDATFALEHKDALMSCLAKCYSNERFSFLWAARSRFDNTGSATLADYRVRFRIAGFSAWSQWHQTSKVYPGQTVVDPYYPVFDLDKLNVLTGPRPVMLEIEYEYRRPNGDKVAESDSRQLEILGYNQTIFSGLASSEIMNFADRLEYMPAVLASFTTPSDPVIQELAGRMSGRTDGAAAAVTNADAVKFLRSLYEFLGENRVSYQSPPSYVNGAQFGQHIKYGRDVLRNHAGTCIDLAILWASTCEAVGLRPVLVVIPGHCFPAIRMPEGQLVAVEATVIGKCDFDKAVEIGDKELQQVRQEEAIVVDVPALRKAGIQSLDLPLTSPNFLTDSGYRFDAKPRVQNAGSRTTTVQASHNERARTNQTRSASPIVGLWGFTGKLGAGNVDLGLALRAEGRMAFVINMQGPDGQPTQLKSVGQWQVDGSFLVLTDENGTNRFEFRLEGEQLVVIFPGLDTTIYFHRVQG